MPCFETLTLSQFKLYIKSETMNECFVYCNCQETIHIWSAEGKEQLFVFYTGSGSMLVCGSWGRQMSMTFVYKNEHIWYQ